MYAELFPTHVRAMVLDGAIDPALPTVAYATEQADSLESELQSFLAWCTADRGCPWHPLGDPTASLLGLIQGSQTRPLPVAGGAGGRTRASCTTPCWPGSDARSSWPTLADALAGAASGDGSAAATMAAGYEAGGSTNGADAEEAIDCLDHPVDRNPSSYPGLADRAGPVGSGVRSLPGLGPARLRHLGGPPDPDPGTGIGPGGTAHPGGGNDRRPGHPVPVGGGPGQGAHRWGPPHLAGPEPRGLLLQLVRESLAQAYLVAGTLPAPGTICTD